MISKYLKKFISRNPTKANYKFIMKDWVGLTDLSLCNEVLNTTRFVKNLQPIVLNVPVNKRVLVVAAHPDDDIFGAGGTMIELRKRNSNVDVIYLIGQTNTGDSLPIKADQLKICKELGVTPHFLDCREGRIPFNEEQLIKSLRKLVGKTKPDLLFIPFLLDDHDDHRAANHIFFNVLKDMDLTLEVWSYELSGVLVPNVVINITGSVDRKKELLDMYVSEKSNRNFTHYCLSKNGANCRYIPSKRKEFAETFFVVPVKEYLDLCNKYFSNSPNILYYNDYYKNNYSS